MSDRDAGEPVEIARVVWGLALAQADGDDERVRLLLDSLSPEMKDQVLRAQSRAFVQLLGDLITAAHGVPDPRPRVLETLRENALQFAAGEVALG